MNPEIRVLKCILDDRFGGPHRRSLVTAERLQAQGVTTRFLFGRKHEPGLPDVPGACFLKHLQFMRRRRPLAGLLGFLLFLPANLARIRRIVRAERIDIVDVDGVTNLVPALAAALCRTPLVWCYNDHLPGLVRRLILPLVARLSSTVIVQGQRLREVRTGPHPRLCRKTIVLYPGVDTRRFDPARYDAPTRATLRAQLGVPTDGPLIGMVGNMNRLKGHAYFIRAAQRIKERVENARFIVVGRKLETNPGYWEHIQQVTVECGLKDDMIYAGFQDDVAGVLSILNVFVLASILESCPNVVLEAMAMKVPVVATDVGAVPEMVIHGRTGYVVPPRDAEAMADAVIACLTQPREQVGKMAAAARKRVEEAFSVDIMVYQQLQVYESLIWARSPTAALGRSRG